jgi:NADH:ubiquinone reductase (H+-translocating)
MKRLLVAGGGIAGFGLIKDLLKHISADALHITLADPQADFVFKPILYEQLNGRIVSINRAAFFETHRNQLTHVAQKVSQVQALADQRLNVTFDNEQTQTFDMVVLALGAKTNYFGVPGAPEHCLPLLTQADMERFKLSLDKKLTESAKTQNPVSFEIIGAGLSGVELAFELRAYLENDARKRYGQFPVPAITMIEAMPTILPGFSADEQHAVLSRLYDQHIKVLTNHQVKQVTADAITVKLGEDVQDLPSQDPLWVAGVKANLPETFFADMTVEKYPGSDRIKVTPFLTIPDHANIYVIGDLAGVENPETKRLYATTGQLSDQQSAYVAKRIRRELRKGALADNYPRFEADIKGHFVSLGPGQAAMTFDKAPGPLAGKTVINGLIANVRLAYYGTKMKLR